MKNSAADKAKGIVKDYEAKEIVKDKNGVDQIYLRNRSGSSVQVSLNGGQILSWKTDRGEELLFISRKAMPTAVRGGIHIGFPLFGNRGALEKHGFAENRMWLTDNNPSPLDSNDSNDKTYIELLADLSADDHKDHKFEFRLRVALALDGSLVLTSRIRNIGHKRFSFYIAHHTYFSVSDISDVRVEGLESLHYLDNLLGREYRTEQETLTFDSKVDRVYLGSVEKTVVFIHNPMRMSTFQIKKEGLRDVVVWNPWREKSKATAELAPEEYKHMVCVGGAAIEEPLPLNPGEEWTGKLELSYKRSGLKDH